MNVHKELSVSAIDASTAYQWLLDGREIAFIDVREEGQHGLGHPLLAANVPYSRLEADFPERVPRLSTRILLLGDDKGSAEKAARRLHRLGYFKVDILADGLRGWQAAGYEVFDGTNVPSKAFAEVLEIEAHTPHISAEDLQELRQSGSDFVLLDTRTPEEFGRFHVPGAQSAPGVELVYRAESLIPSPDTLVVISCAGRTRSIIGAQGLINAGIANRVVSLAGGTQGWRLAGFDLESSPAGVLPKAHESETGLQRAEALRRKHDIESIDLDALETLRAADATVFVFDVRTEAEYEAGHVPGSRWVPGGQLVQGIDNWVGVRNARLVLTDDDGVRATVAAHWLAQLGWNVGILPVPADHRVLVAGKRTPDVHPAGAKVEVIEAANTQAWLGDDGAIVSADISANYRKAHPQGAHWANRSQIDQLPAEVTSAKRILVVGSNPVLAALLADELSRTGKADVRLLEGNREIWEAVGLTVLSSVEPPDSDRVDTLFWNHTRHEGDKAAMKAYLQWELDLPPRIERDGTAGFRIRL